MQLRIESETKKMTKQALEKKRISRNDVLRAFLVRLAATEKVMAKEETWLKEQIEETYSRVDKGKI
ncbi:hypothetical protein, partial [Klebsiella pneumoniae]|uniref:hypothetical protein n=1 Tax=Klebsiella pneumoniae TaxID=573 RepID=UPI001D0E5EBA